MSKLNSKTICLAPWISIHHWPNGKTYPCCLWDSQDPIGDLNQQSLKEIWNSDKLKAARKGMLNGEKISSCSRCYELESTGEHSYRERINEQHSKYLPYLDKTHTDGTLDTMNLHLWDLRISNFCNFKCRSCGADLSSSWHEDTIKLGKVDQNSKALISITDKSKFLEDIEPHYRCVDEIYFAGGEPLLMPEHYQILERLIEIGRTEVNIRYSTNFSKLNFGKKSILEYWKNFKNIELYISVDGVGSVGEYVRKGYDDLTFIQNVQTLRNSHINPYALGYTITYGVLNLLHLFDMILEFMKNDLLDYKTFNHGSSPSLVFNPITYPPYYDCKFIPTRYKNYFINRSSKFNYELKKLGACDAFIEYIQSKFIPIKNHITSEEFNQNNMNEFVSITDRLDVIRKEKFSNTFKYYSSSKALADNITIYQDENLNTIGSLI